MQHPLWAYAFGIFLIAHGAGHAAGFWTGNRVFAVLWLIGLAGFVGAGLAFLGVAVPAGLWRNLALWSAAMSTVLLVVFWSATAGPMKLNALLGNVGILMAILWWHWPVPIASR